MAEWKKIIVSGSDISQLNNDAGYLTSVTAQTAFVTASFNGTHLIADDSEGQLNFVSSSGQGLTIGADAGTDTLTFGLSSIPNTSLENDGITIAGVDTSLGGTITAATIGNAGGFFSSSAQVDHDQTTNFSADEHFTQANITTVGTVTTGDVTAILPAGTVSGSAQIDHDQTTNFSADEHFTQANITTVGTVTTGDVSAILPAGTVSGSSLSSTSQGSVTLTTNGVAGAAVDLGLETTDSPTFASLTLTGDLNVQGTTTTIDTANLAVEDKFILINSGSSTAEDESGIIFGGSNGSVNNGAALIWNGDYNGSDGRLAIANSVNADATDATVSYYVGGVFDGTANDAETAQADHRGNIRVDSSDDIWIYV